MLKCLLLDTACQRGKKRSDLESSVRANRHAIERESGSGDSEPPIFKSRAVLLGVYPVRRTISQMRSCTSLLAAFVLFLLITRETVEMDTPASLAISLSVINQPPFLVFRILIINASLS